MKKFNKKIPLLFASFALMMGIGFVGSKNADSVKAETVKDVLVNTDTVQAIGTTYKEWNTETNNVTYESGASYIGQSAGESGTIQLRSKNSNSGVVSKKSGGYIRSIEVKAHSTKTTADRTLNFYAANSPFDSASKLYASGLTPTGTLTIGPSITTAKFDVVGDFEHFGIRSSNSAIYLESITIEWEKTAPKTVTSVTSVESHPTEIFVGKEIAGDDVKLNIAYDDETSGIVSADHVTVDSSIAATGVTATAYYDAEETLFADFTVDVIAPTVYEKVTNNTIDTNSNYLLAFVDGVNANVYNGVDEASNSVATTIVDNRIVADDKNMAVIKFEETSTSDTYKVNIVSGKDNVGKYIEGMPSDNNGTKFVDDSVGLAISWDSEGNLILSSSFDGGNNIFTFNKTDGNKRFRFYKSVTVSKYPSQYAYPTLFKLISTESEDPVNPQTEANKFVQEWLALRNEEGSICDQLNGEATALKDMIAKYDALTPEVKTIVDASLDREGNTIQNSVEYLRSFLGLDEAPSADQSAGGLLLTAVKDNAGTIAIVIALIAGTFVGYIILRRKNKLVKTSK